MGSQTSRNILLARHLHNPGWMGDPAFHRSFHPRPSHQVDILEMKFQSGKKVEADSDFVP